ncbi:MAG: DnaJ domain-containing protein [Phycisphaerae bacterium]|nr:DnaJ domain-containing protein [Phycisphaerae bacterium]MDP7286902.1 DnaJ domain-containing protein [Phycisphaerae bacterium]
MGEKDYYKILGLTRDASPEEIKRAYRTLVKQVHPDVSGDPDSAKRFGEIDEAYDVLGDAQARWEYDHRTEPSQENDPNRRAPRGISPGELAGSQFTPANVAEGAGQAVPDWRKRGKRRRRTNKIKWVFGYIMFSVALVAGFIFVPCWVMPIFIILSVAMFIPRFRD